MPMAATVVPKKSAGADTSLPGHHEPQVNCIRRQGRVHLGHPSRDRPPPGAVRVALGHQTQPSGPGESALPFTPFHLGPACALKVVAGQSFSLTVFAFSQVVMDVEPLLYLLCGKGIVHGVSHTYLGG